MDNVGNNSQRSNNLDEPIPFDMGPDEPSRPEVNPAGSPPNVSRAPLNLGGGAGAPAQIPKPAAQAPRPPASRPPGVRPAGPRPAASAGLAERITACKTFFTKLHPGAIKFLEEQITGWLKENPSVVVKRTNVIMGEVQEKKTEPNIVIVIWY